MSTWEEPPELPRAVVWFGYVSMIGIAVVFHAIICATLVFLSNRIWPTADHRWLDGAIIGGCVAWFIRTLYSAIMHVQTALWEQRLKMRREYHR
jgi:hypothetical protein